MVAQSTSTFQARQDSGGASENVSGLFVPADESKLAELVKGKKSKFILSTSLTNEEYSKFFASIKGSQLGSALYTLPTPGT